jgi:hypothetical protein
MAKITRVIDALGPLIHCSLSVSSERKRILELEQKEIPKRVIELRGLVDTGADSVLIDSRHVALLQLPVRTPTTKTATIDGHSQRLRTKCEIGLIIHFENDEKAQWDGPAHCDDTLLDFCDFDLIIGRNVLSALNLHYDGPNSVFTISHNYSPPA